MVFFILLILNSVIFSNEIITYPNHKELSELKIMKEKLHQYNENSKTKISAFTLQNTSIDQLQKSLKLFFPNLKISFNHVNNTLLVEHKKENEKKINTIIKSLDVKTQEVYLKCEIY